MKNLSQMALVVLVMMVFAGCNFKDSCFAYRSPKHVMDERNGHVSLEELAYLAGKSQLVNGDTASFYAKVSDITTVAAVYNNICLDYLDYLDYDDSQESRDSIYMICLSTEGTYQRTSLGGDPLKYCFVAKTKYTDSVISGRTSDSIYLTALMLGSCEDHIIACLTHCVYDNKKMFFKDETE